MLGTFPTYFWSQDSFDVSAVLVHQQIPRICLLLPAGNRVTGFSLGVGNLNTGCHVCAMSILPTKMSLQTLQPF